MLGKKNIFDNLFYWSIFFLPHMAFFTNKYNVRPSELFLISFLPFFALKINIKITPQFKILAGLFLFNFIYYLYGLNNIDIITSFEYSYSQHALFKLALSFLCFAYFFIIISCADLDKTLRFWFYGFLFSFFTHVIFFLFSDDLNLKRAGVLYEGNFSALYYLLTLQLIFFTLNQKNANLFFIFKQKFLLLAAAFTVIGIFMTQSTIGILLLIFNLFVVSLKDFKFKNLLYLAGSCCTFIFFFLPDIKEKLFGDTLNYLTNSRLDRISLIKTGLNSFNENPFFGTGFSSFSYINPKFFDDFMLTFYTFNVPRISNNVYVDLLVDNGLIGTIIFLFMMYFLLFPKKCTFLYIVFLFSTFVYFNAFPSLYIPFIWCGLALFYKINNIK
jgi:O-antigen ligase